MTGPAPESAGFDPSWLALREPADRAARAERWSSCCGPRSGPGGRCRCTIWAAAPDRCRAGWRPGCPDHSTGCCTTTIPACSPRPSAGCAGLVDAAGHPVRIETRTTDLARLRPADLTGAHLVTASALLDLLTADELDALAEVCAAARCPALLTLSVAGPGRAGSAGPAGRRRHRRVQRAPATHRGRSPAARPGRARGGGRGVRPVRDGRADRGQPVAARRRPNRS